MLLSPILIGVVCRLDVVVGRRCIVMGLVARNILPSLDVVLVAFVSGCFSMFRRMVVMLMASDSRSRVHTNIVVVALDDNLVSVVATMPLVMSMMIVVVMVSMIFMPWVR